MEKFDPTRRKERKGILVNTTSELSVRLPLLSLKCERSPSPFPRKRSPGFQEQTDLRFQYMGEGNVLPSLSDTQTHLSRLSSIDDAVTYAHFQYDTPSPPLTSNDPL